MRGIQVGSCLAKFEDGSYVHWRESVQPASISVPRRESRQRRMGFRPLFGVGFAGVYLFGGHFGGDTWQYLPSVAGR